MTLTSASAPYQQQDTCLSADTGHSTRLSPVTPKLRSLQHSITIQAKGNKELTLRSEQEVSVRTGLCLLFPMSGKKQSCKCSRQRDDSL